MTIFYQDNTPFRMQYCSKETVGCVNNSKEIEGNKKNCKTMAMSIGTSESDSSSSHVTNSNSANKEANGSKSRAMGKRPGKRPGRKPAKIDERAKLERSRQSAKECRARKKLRYQYLEELVLNREKAVFSLREELETCKAWCQNVDNGIVPSDLQEKIAKEEQQMATSSNAMTSFSTEEEDEISMVDFSSELSFHDHSPLNMQESMY